jgi:dihydrodipicolinate synthase/N-acetylneuraminate lyase
MYLALKSGSLPKAQRIAGPLADLTAALFLETNPVPVKYALSLTGLMLPKVRLPLAEASAEVKERVAVEMDRASERYDSSAPLANEKRKWSALPALSQRP